MTMDISRLAIEVTTTGIREASVALSGLGRSAGNADTKVEGLTAKLAALMQASGNVIGNASGLSGIFALVAGALSNAATSAQQTAQALAQVNAGLGTLTQTSQQTNAALRGTAHHGGVVTTTLKAMATAALTYFSIGSAKHLIEQSDAWGMMQAKLKLATGSMEEAKRVQGQLFDMAQNMRAPLDDMGKLYTRLAPALGRMGKSAQDTRNMVEGVTLALKLGGATSGEAASTMLQFSQAANAGRLNGAEFNSVAENGVVILRALEDHLGKNQAELKKMGAEGTLTFDLISAAMEKQLPKWREDFKTLPVTFESAMQRLKNAWFRAVGEMGQETELGKKLAETLLKLEEDLPRIASAIVGALNFIIDNGKLMGVMFAGILGLGVAKWGMEAAAALITLSNAVTAAGGAAALARGALSFLGGPVGILVGLATAAGAAWLAWGSDAEKGSDKITKKTQVDVQARINELDREIAKLRERNRLAGGGAPVAAEVTGTALDPAKQQLQDDMIRLQTQVADKNLLPIAKALLEVEIAKKQVQFEGLYAREESLKLLGKEAEAMERAKKLEEVNKDFRKSFDKQDESRIQDVITEWKKKLGEGFTDDHEKKIRESFTHAAAKGAKEGIRQQKLANAELEQNKKLLLDVTQAYEQLQKTRQLDEKFTPIQREHNDLMLKLGLTTDKTAQAGLRSALAKNEEARAMEVQFLALKDQIKSEEDYTKAQDASQASAEKELKGLEDKIAGYGKAKGALEEYALVEAKRELLFMSSGGATDQAIAKQQALVDTLEKVHAAKEKLGQLELGDQIDKFFDTAKVADFGNAFGDAFGKAGKAVDKAGKSLDQYQKKMVANDNARKKIEKETDSTRKSADLEKLRKKELADTLDMYGDMAGAVKGFFSEKTVAYKAFNALEQGFRVARIAMEIQEFAIKQMNERTWLGLKIQSVMTSMGLDAVETASSVTNSGVKAAASTTAGVAKAFEQMGVWGFVGAAAIIAFMASMGVGGGGGGGGGLRNPKGEIETLEERQKRNGTGTVLGDDTAKSESIAKSLEILRDNSNIGLQYTSNMLASLRNIELSMSGLTSAILRVKGMTTGKNFGISTGTESKGGLLDAITGLFGLFSSKVTREITDTGLVINGKVSDLLNGSGLQQYVDVHETKKKLFGSSTSDYRQTKAADNDITEYVGGVFDQLNDAITTAATGLGANAISVRKQLESFVISTEVSFKDLKGADLQAALDAVFSGAGDDMARMVFPAVEAFQAAGEGYFQTLVRVASGTERAKDALGKLDVQMVDVYSLVNKTGDIGLELVRESLMASETGTSLREILRLLDGSMKDLIDSYRVLTDLRNSMQVSGLGSNLSLSLLKGAGGLSELQGAFNDYFDGFFTDEQKRAMAMSRLRMEFGRLNLAVPASKDAFKSLVTTLMAGGTAGEELAGRVLVMSGAFADAMSEMDAAKEERIDTAKSDLSAAYDKEAEALENLRDKMKGFADSLRDFRDSLTMGDMSTLSTYEKYQQANAKYNDVSSKALGGDVEAIEQFQAAANELLEFSRDVNASGSQYTADFQRVLSETDALQKYTSTQVDAATESLNILKEQVKGLIDIDESVKTVATAIADLQRALTGVASPEDGAPTSPVDVTGPAAAIAALETQKANAALLAEMQAMRVEVQTLRAEQAKQTEALVNANLVAAELAAKLAAANAAQLSEEAQRRATMDFNNFIV